MIILYEEVNTQHEISLKIEHFRYDDHLVECPLIIELVGHQFKTKIFKLYVIVVVVLNWKLFLGLRSVKMIDDDARRILSFSNSVFSVCLSTCF